MILMGGIAGFWILALLTLDGALFGGTQSFNSLNEPDVPFPPARPTVENCGAICQHGNGRPRYPSSFFPSSGVSHFRRRGDAINRLEAWYSVCCSEQVTSEHTLCCVRQAWKQSLTQFCREEYATMTTAYECCGERGEARWTCFDSELPNPLYSPTTGYMAPRLPRQPRFTFYSRACKGEDELNVNYPITGFHSKMLDKKDFVT